MVCEECGYAMHGHATTRKSRRGEKRRHTYYQCTGRESQRFGGQRLCWSKPLRADLVEELVWKDVCGLLSEPDRLKEEFQRRLDGNRKELEADAVKELNQQIQKLKKAIGRLIDAYSEGLLDKSEFDPRVRKSKERLEKLKEELKVKAHAAEETKELTLLMTRFEDSHQASGGQQGTSSYRL
jgi:site-specific DNA recombinase